MVGCRAWHRERWLDVSLQSGAFMHNWHNCRQQTCLADSPDSLFTYMPEPTGIWDRLRREMDFIEELPATGG